MYKMQISKTLYENQCQTFSSHNKNEHFSWVSVSLCTLHAATEQMRKIPLTHMLSAVKPTPYTHSYWLLIIPTGNPAKPSITHSGKKVNNEMLTCQFRLTHR